MMSNSVSSNRPNQGAIMQSIDITPVPQRRKPVWMSKDAWRLIQELDVAIDNFCDAAESHRINSKGSVAAIDSGHIQEGRGRLCERKDG